MEQELSWKFSRRLEILQTLTLLYEELKNLKNPIKKSKNAKGVRAESTKVGIVFG